MNPDNQTLGTEQSSSEHDSQLMIVYSENSLALDILQDETDPNFLNLKFSNLLYSRPEQLQKALVKFKSTAEVIQNILDSKNCIETRACQTSIAEKFDTIPL